MRFLKVDYGLLSLSALTLTEKIVLCYILSWVNTNKVYDKGAIYLSRALGLSVRQVRRILSDLEVKRLISITKGYKLIITINFDILRDMLNPQSYSNLCELFNIVYDKIR